MPQAGGPANGFNLGRFYAAEQFELWPENWPAWSLWCEMSGQWRMGFNGPTALDYGTLFARMERMSLDDGAWNDLFADIRVIEAAALEQMAKT